MKNVNKKGCAGRLRQPDRGLLMARPFLVASVDVEGSILVMMMARRVGFASVTSELVSIRFRLAVRRLRGLMLGVYNLRNLVFLTASRHIPC